MDKITRIFAFLVICLGIRLLFAYIAKNLSKENLRLSSIPAAILGLTFIILYLFDLRKTGVEAGGTIWWNKIRPIHGVIYILYAIYAFKGEKNAYYVLIFDVLVGFIAWLNNYYLKIMLN